ncbi:hypothetical protein ACH474_25115 [Nocardia rhamnosiphila]|nr:hypothetical protein [Nocardia rhamnosiphila]
MVRPRARVLRSPAMDSCYANYLDDEQIYDPTDLSRGNRNTPPTTR